MPTLNIPHSTATVQIYAIDTTSSLTATIAESFWAPKIKGFTSIRFPVWAFLIVHPSGRKLVYDLGIRKDWQNLSPVHNLQAMLDAGFVSEIAIKEDVASILKAGGVSLAEIEGLIWSHWHFDHTGDPSTFPTSSKLIVGPGFKETFLPGYPADPDGHCLESDFKDREVQELDFGTSEVHVGRFKAIDYFGDGSFYILDSPGHAIGHLNALARSQASPESSFIHLGGDSAHHPGEFRPSDLLPLPDNIEPSPVPGLHANICPGHLFSPILRDGSKTKHILEWQDAFRQEGADPRFGLIYNEDDLKDTIRKDEEFDANADVLTLIAHDMSLKGVIDEFPKPLNAWREQGVKKQVMWQFLRDFEGALH